jgi:hypothetical protein
VHLKQAIRLRIQRDHVELDKSLLCPSKFHQMEFVEVLSTNAVSALQSCLSAACSTIKRQALRAFSPQQSRSSASTSTGMNWRLLRRKVVIAGFAVLCLLRNLLGIFSKQWKHSTRSGTIWNFRDPHRRPTPEVARHLSDCVSRPTPMQLKVEVEGSTLETPPAI